MIWTTMSVLLALLWVISIVSKYRKTLYGLRYAQIFFILPGLFHVEGFFRYKRGIRTFFRLQSTGPSMVNGDFFASCVTDFNSGPIQVLTLNTVHFART